MQLKYFLEIMKDLRCIGNKRKKKDKKNLYLNILQ